MIPFTPNQTPDIFSGRGEVLLKDATATIKQAGLEIDQAIDRIEGGANGWGLFGGQNQDQAAVFQTVVPLDTDQLTFTATTSGVSVSGSGNVTAGATIGFCPFCDDISFGFGFSFSNQGITLDLPSPVPDLTVNF